MSNPVDKVLQDWVSAETRRKIHNVLTLVAFIVAAVAAAGENWKEALVALFITAYGASNRANTHPEES